MHPNLLISAQELQEKLQEQLIIIDCSFDLTAPERYEGQYAKAHIPGAHYAHLGRDLSASPVVGKTGGHPLPDKSQFQGFLQRLGVEQDSQVVVYDHASGTLAATRLWWLLKWAGVERVRLLDGGFQAWQQADGATTDRLPSKRHSTYVPTYNDRLWISTEELITLMDTREFVLLDARNAARFRGEVEPYYAKAGHIPGACNLPCAENLDEKGYFLPAHVLKKRFSAHIAPAKPVISSCGSGVTACHNIFAMELAKLPAPRLYVGSFSEWVTDPNRAVISGDK